MDLIALAVLALGAYYVLTGSLPFNLGSTGSMVAPTPQQATAIQAAQIAAQQAAEFQQSQETTRSGTGAIAATTSAAGIALGTTSGLASAGAIAGSTALLTTGIAAAAGLLVWGIVQKGWFRGGEEGVVVNPARDQFIQVWINVYYPGEGSARQFEAMARATQDANLNGNYAQQLIKAIYDADTMDEFTAAAQNFVRALQEGH